MNDTGKAISVTNYTLKTDSELMKVLSLLSGVLLDRHTDIPFGSFVLPY